MFEEASNRITVWLSKTKIISSDQEEDLYDVLM